MAERQNNDYPIKVTLTDEEALYLSLLPEVSELDADLAKKSPKADKLRRIIDCAYKYMEELAPHLEKKQLADGDKAYDPDQPSGKGFATEEFARFLVRNGKFRAAVRFLAGDCQIHCGRGSVAGIAVNPCRLFIESRDPAGIHFDNPLQPIVQSTIIAVDAISSVSIVSGMNGKTLDYSPVIPETMSEADYFLIDIA